MKFSSSRTIRRIEAGIKERRLWRTISTINGRNQGLFSVPKILAAEYSDAYHDEIAQERAFAPEEREAVKVCGETGRPLQFLLHEKVSPSALTRHRMKGNLNYRVIARGHNQATRR